MGRLACRLNAELNRRPDGNAGDEQSTRRERGQERSVTDHGVLPGRTVGLVDTQGLIRFWETSEVKRVSAVQAFWA